MVRVAAFSMQMRLRWGPRGRATRCGPFVVPPLAPLGKEQRPGASAVLHSQFTQAVTQGHGQGRCCVTGHTV